MSSSSDSRRSPSSLIVVAAIASLATVATISYHIGRRQQRRQSSTTATATATATTRATTRATGTPPPSQPAAADPHRPFAPSRAPLETAIYTSGLTVHPIGTVRSIYRLCVGTPRQGQLAPSSRGQLELHTAAAAAADGLGQFSHVWIVFVFHLNTAKAGGRGRPTPSKIAPPALGGKKVGVMATRSPHRHNPIGITLCELESIRTIAKHEEEKDDVETKTTSDMVGSKLKNKKKNKKKKRTVTVLNLRGLDLVDGTPVLDVKPYVPHYDTIHPAASVRVPTWVREGLSTQRPVTITPRAKQQLHNILRQGEEEEEETNTKKKNKRKVSKKTSVLRFYPNDDTATADEVLSCVRQVLAADVRSAWQTQKARRGEFQAERANRIHNNDEQRKGDNNGRAAYCTQQLDNLLIGYTVTKPTEQQRAAYSEGSGAEDVVTVESIQLLSTTTTTPSSYSTSKTIVEDVMAEEGSSRETLTAITNVTTINEEGETNVEAIVSKPQAAAIDDDLAEDTKPPPDETHQECTSDGRNGDSKTPAPVNANTESMQRIRQLPESVEQQEKADDVDATTTASALQPPQSLRQVSSSTLGELPKDQDYRTLKSYWNRAARKRTPGGLVPAEQVRQSAHGGGLVKHQDGS